VNAQLIDARSDAHLWAQTYDRDLADLFAIQSEIAKAIADQLQAKLTAHEKTTLERKPTTNLEAYDAYLRGLAYSRRPFYDSQENLDAIKYFDEAVKLDPTFALAWAWLASENALGYFNKIGNDVPALCEAAKRAVDKAIELQPDLGEAYLAQGYAHRFCDMDYDSAIASFEKAGRLLPNNSQILQALGRIDRRKGQWQRSLEYYRQASELDPRDALLLSDQAIIFWNLRQYRMALKACDQILDIIPDNADSLALKAEIHQAEGNLPAAAAILSQLHPEPISSLYGAQIEQAIYERRYAQAIAALKMQIAKPDPAAIEWNLRNKAQLAWLEELSGDTAAAHLIWQQVRSEVEASHLIKGENFAFDTLASAYVALGDKAKAFAIVKQAAVDPTSNDALTKVLFPEAIAKIAAQAGEKDLALKQLAICAQTPVGIFVSYGDLKLNPWWDSLRGDPRFEKIVASLAPK
jgi:tetratricopeptide (TPR) repeat protein